MPDLAKPPKKNVLKCPKCFKDHLLPELYFDKEKSPLEANFHLKCGLCDYRGKRIDLNEAFTEFLK